MEIRWMTATMIDGFTRGQWVNEGLTVVTVKE